MFELFLPISGPDRFVLLLVSVVMATTMLMVVANVGFCQWRKVREREAAANLVHDMLAKGFSTEEIERVLSGAGIAKPGRHGGFHRC
ncbi:MAG: hypothetical protein AB7U20_13080 [Planctomycetaceae bacterium]